MARSETFGALCKRFFFRIRRDDLSAQVRRTLVSTLYTQPASLAIGAFNGIAGIDNGGQLFMDGFNAGLEVVY